jgi:hypothetical protein
MRCSEAHNGLDDREGFADDREKSRQRHGEDDRGSAPALRAIAIGYVVGGALLVPSLYALFRVFKLHGAAQT